MKKRGDARLKKNMRDLPCEEDEGEKKAQLLGEVKRWK